MLLLHSIQTMCFWVVFMMIMMTATTTTITTVHGFGNFVLPKNIFSATNPWFTNKETSPTIVRTNIEAQVSLLQYCIYCGLKEFKCLSHRSRRIPFNIVYFLVKKKKLELLNAIRGTNNGKTATPSQQIQILQLVRDIEMTQPNISLRDPNIVSVLNGTWYLQYTSPSTVESTTITTPTDEDDNNAQQQQQQQQQQSSTTSTAATISYDIWEPNNAPFENVETQRFNARGTVSAAGITIDTSRNNALVQQIFYTDTNTVMNRIYFTKDTSNNNDIDTINYALAGGTYRPSTIQPNRAIVAFDTAQIRIPITKFNVTITIPLGWIFAVVAIFRKGNRDNGWLETTFVDTSLRIGRGNKGTMFILTREPLS